LIHWDSNGFLIWMTKRTEKRDEAVSEAVLYTKGR
jgi:hypothetical protein